MQLPPAVRRVYAESCLLKLTSISDEGGRVLGVGQFLSPGLF